MESDSQNTFQTTLLSQVFQNVSNSQPSLLANKILERYKPSKPLSHSILSESTFCTEEERPPGENEAGNPLDRTLTQSEEDLEGAASNTRAPSVDEDVRSIPGDTTRAESSRGAENCRCAACTPAQQMCLKNRPPSCMSSCSNSLPFHGASNPCLKCSMRDPCSLASAPAEHFSRAMPFMNPFAHAYPPPPLSVASSQTSLPSSMTLQFPYQGFPMSSIQAPRELTFPGKICVGDSQNLLLTLQNQLKNVFYKVSFISAFLNMESISLDMSGVSFPEMISQSSGPSTDVQISLTPKFDGKVQVIIQIACLNSETLLGQTLFTTSILYESVTASISVLHSGNDTLDLGTVTAGSTFTEHITVSNNCEAIVPLCIQLSQDVEDNRIHIGLQQMRLKNPPPESEWKMLTPKSMLYRLPPASGKSPSQLEVPIVFEAGNENSYFNFHLSVAVPNTQSSTCSGHSILQFLRIFGVVGSAVQLALVDNTQKRLVLNTPIGSSRSCVLYLKNCTNLPVVYNLVVASDEASSFSVSPATLNLQAMQTCDVTVSFSPSSRIVAKGTLQATAHPQGNVFHLAEVIGNGTPTNSNQATVDVQSNQRPRERANASSSPNLVECNKKYLAWDGADVECATSKSFNIRNCLSKVMQLKLYVREKISAFKLLDDSNEPHRSLNIEIPPNELKKVSVIFTPTAIAAFSDFLGMKPINENSERIVYNIPLYGYGGSGALRVLEAVEKEGAPCMNVPGGKPSFKITVHNTGIRPIFVKVTFVSGAASNNQLIVHPSEFILLEDEKKSLILSSSANFMNMSGTYVSFNYGDEILRQELRRFSGSRGDLNSKLSVFDVPFLGEERVRPESNHMIRGYVSKFFEASLKKYLVLLNVSDEVNSSQMSFFTPSIVDYTFSSLAWNSSHSSTRRMTADARNGLSPPVKDTVNVLSRLSVQPGIEEGILSAEPFPVPRLDFEYCNEESGKWLLKPDTLTIDANNKDNRICLVNLSKKDLRFKVESAIEMISVSPLWGIVSSSSHIGLRITIIPHGKMSNDYKGEVKVLCGNSEKTVLVNVMKEQKKKEQLSSLGPSLQSRSVENLCAEVTGLCSDSDAAVRSLSDFPKEVALKDAISGKLTETTIVIQNTEKYQAEWRIEPSAVTFTESQEDASDGTLQVVPSSGALKPMEVGNIVVRFSPSRADVFFRFFLLSVAYANRKQQTCTFRVTARSVSNSSNENSQANKSSSAAAAKTKRCHKDIYLDNDCIDFNVVAVGQSRTLYIKVCNPTLQDEKITVVKPQLPFSMKSLSFVLKSKKSLQVPVTCKPQVANEKYEDSILLLSNRDHKFKITCKAESKN